MATKKKGLAAFVAKKKSVEAKPAKSNPPPLTDFVEFIVPGFAGYAGTRFTSRAIHQMALKRWPKMAKHASVMSTFAAAASAWLIVHRIKRFEKYHTPVVVGAGIAALQTLVQAYVPKYGWLVSDHNMNALPPAQPQTVAPQVSAPQETAGIPALFTSWKPSPTKAEATGAPKKDDDMDIDLGDDDFDLGSLGASDVDGDGLSDADIDDLLN